MTKFIQDIVLISHGDKADRVQKHSQLQALKAEIEPALNGFTIHTVALSDPGAVEKLFSTIQSKPLVVSLLFSEGFFYRSRVLTPARSFWNDVDVISPFVSNDDLAHGIVQRAIGLPQLIIAHGSKKSEASRNNAQDLAERMSLLLDNYVDCAYLEEEPFADAFIATLTEPVEMVGLFLEAGLHGGDDFSNLLSSAPKGSTGYILGRTDLCSKVVLEAIKRKL